MRIAIYFLASCVFGVVVGGDLAGIKKFGITGDAALQLGKDLFEGPYKNKEMENEIPKMGGNFFSHSNNFYVGNKQVRANS